MPIDDAKTAIHDNDAERLSCWLRHNSSQEVLKELWWEAVSHGSTPSLTVLMENGAEFDARDHQSLTAMHRLTEDGNLEALRLLLSYGADMAATNAQHRTPLHIAVRQGHEECVRLLLEEGAHIWSEDSNGTTAIVYATRFLNITRMLLDHMKRIEDTVSVPDEYRKRQINRSILNATLLERTDVLQALIEAGADCNAYDGRPLNTALMRGNAEVVRILLEGGARPALCRLTILRPMFVAVFRGHVECVKLLLQHGGEVNEMHSNGDTPLLTAASERQTDMVKYLIEHGADINHHGGHGLTALHHSVYLGEKDMTQILLANGANPNIGADDGVCPLHYLLTHLKPLTSEHYKCMRLLLDFEVDVNAICEDSRNPQVRAFTPILLAWWYQHIPAIQMLLSIGCNAFPSSKQELLALRERGVPNSTISDTMSEYLDRMSTVPDLQTVCRKAIRHFFSGRLNDMHELALPTPIKEYLDYSDLDDL